LRGFLDRDFLKTVEGLLFCVVGGVHPKDRVISYLKYLPSQEGRWGRGSERYVRTMPNYTIPSLLDNINMLARKYPQYILNSRVFHVRMSAVPRRLILEHYRPEEKLGQLLKSVKLDPLQEKVVQLVHHLSEKTGVSKDHFGITGSVLLDIHQSNFSDIDLIVYGHKNSSKIRQTLQEEFRKKDFLLRRHSGKDLEKLLERWSRNYPITLEEAREIYERRWNYGFFDGKAFSIHPVKMRSEIKEKYGTKVFLPEGIVEGRARIIGVADSLFLPCTYVVEEFEANGRAVHGEVREMTSFDGFYVGILNIGDEVKVKGKLERVLDKKSGETYYRILVGSPEARGQDYIKPVSLGE